MNNKWVYFFAGLISATILYAIIVLSIIVVDTKIKDKKKEGVIKTGSFVCNDLGTVSNTFNPNVIISDGNLYSITLDLKFSNEQNCMKIADTVITKVIDEYYVSDEAIYTISSGKLEEASSDRIPSNLLEEDVLMAYSYGKSSEYKYYVLKTDGKIYDYNFDRSFTFVRGEGRTTYTLLSSELVSEFDGEVITSFMVSKGEITFVKTDKFIYVNGISNPECVNYADVECIYSLNKFEKIDRSLEEVKYVNIFDNNIKFIDSSNDIYSIGI